MTILVVDDERTLNLKDAYHVQSCSEAIYYLKDHPIVSELWLDHDLGPDEDIMRLVDYLQEEAFFGRGYEFDRIVVHSMNPVAFDKINRALSRYYPVHRVNVTPFLLSVDSTQRS